MKNVLIVEDDKASNLLYEIILKDKYNIFSTENTSNVEELIINNNIDLILLDYHIGPINGIKIGKIVKEKFPKVKIILQTAYSRNLLKINKDDFNGFFEKPITSNKLKLMLDSAFNE